MQNVLLKSLSFVFIIIIAYCLKRFGVVKTAHRALLSKIMMTVTLPCALITSFASSSEGGNILFTLIGFLMVFIPLMFNFFTTMKKSKEARAFYMFNASGYNIGCFALPFIQAFFSPNAVLATCMFDAGNALLVTGGSYAFANAALKLNGKTSFLSIIKQIFSSVPFDAYVILFVLAAFSIRVPQEVLTVISPIADANAFIAMCVIGLMLEFKIPEGEKFTVVRVVITRMAFAAIFAAVFYFLTPFSLEIRQILCLLAFAPASALSPIFCEKAGANEALSGFANSVTIIISIFLTMIFIANTAA